MHYRTTFFILFNVFQSIQHVPKIYGFFVNYIVEIFILFFIFEVLPAAWKIHILKN